MNRTVTKLILVQIMFLAVWVVLLLMYPEAILCLSLVGTIACILFTLKRASETNKAFSPIELAKLVIDDNWMWGVSLTFLVLLEFFPKGVIPLFIGFLAAIFVGVIISHIVRLKRAKPQQEEF